VLKGLKSESGQSLLHDEFHYTLNQLPEGPLATTPIARLVPPPPARESGMEGYLRLTYGDAFDQWKHKGWTQGKGNPHRDSGSGSSSQQSSTQSSGSTSAAGGSSANQSSQQQGSANQSQNTQQSGAQNQNSQQYGSSSNTQNQSSSSSK
jgi:hypothetical protein